MFHKHQPCGVLARYVRSFWYQPASVAAPDAGMLTLATGQTELVISLDNQPQAIWADADPRAPAATWRRATLRLPHGGPVASALVGGGAALGISFAPGGLRHFMPLAMSDFGAEVVSYRDVFGAWGAELIERLAAPSPAATKFALVESWLWARLREPHRAHRQVDHAVALLSDPFERRSMNDVADAVGLSARRLQDLFREDVGMAPKTFARVMRFGAALRLVRQHGRGQWAQVAALCHYADQAHLANEFRVLAGMSPGAYLERPTTGHANCLPWQPPRPAVERPAAARQLAPAST